MAELATNQQFIRLEAMLVPASCERIKQVLCRELGLASPSGWRGRIFVRLRPARTRAEPIGIASDRFKDGWQYEVLLPEVVERTRYVRAMVQVLLQEMANRTAAAHSAELPAWLVEGMARQIFAANELEIILPAPRPMPSGFRFSTTFVDARQTNALTAAHQQLCAQSPLTFEELSWPAPDQWEGSAAELYRSSAQLFVNQLLGLPDGPACLRAMLEQLPRYYNWQLPFLHAFGGFFKRPLEVEKWWALQVAQFTGCDLGLTWPPEQGWRKLEESLLCPVQIRTATNDLPLRAELSLQTIIRQWDAQPQGPILDARLRALQFFRLRAAPAQAALVDDYRHVVQTYLRARDKPGMIPFRRKAIQRQAADQAVKQLDALDAKRLALERIRGPLLPNQAQAESGAGP